LTYSRIPGLDGIKDTILSTGKTVMATNSNPFVNNYIDLQNVSLDIRGINSNSDLQAQINKILTIVNPDNGTVTAKALSNLTRGIPINVFGGINLSNSGLYSNDTLINFNGTGGLLPPGGNAGYVLTKNSGVDFDVGWLPPNSSINSGIYKVAFSEPSVFSTVLFDTSNFPARIGTWATPTPTTLELTFNSEYYTLVNIPNISGNVYWWNGTVYKVNPIPTIGVSGAFPGAIFIYNGINWIMRYSITGTTYASGTNIGLYGFNMYLNVLN